MKPKVTLSHKVSILLALSLSSPLFSFIPSLPFHSQPLSWALPNPKTTHSPPTRPLPTLTPPRLPKLLREIETKYSKAKTLSADFTQTNESLTFSKPKISTGKIYIKRPDKFRWETEKPDSNLVITHQNRVIYYTPPFEPGEEGQLIEQEVSSAQSRLVNTLLAGSFSLSKEMRIQQKDPTHFILTPKKGTAGTVEKATLEINPKSMFIQKVTLKHQGGNTSEIQLSQIQLGRPLKDELFQFTLPSH